MIGGGRLPGALAQRISLIVSALALPLLLILLVVFSPAPVIDQDFGDTRILIRADRAWTLLPGDCVNLQWQLEGIASLHVEGGGKVGADEMRFCPDINAASALFEVRAQNGIYRSIRLQIHHLPDLLFYLVGFAVLVGSPLLAIYYLWLPQLGRPLPLIWLLPGLAALLAFGAWLRLTPHEPPLIDEASGAVARRIWAEHDGSLFPHECVAVGWSVVGARTIWFNDREVAADANPAYAEHCAEDGHSARIEVMSEDGEIADAILPIPALFPGRALPPPFFYISLLGIALGLLTYAPLLARYVGTLRAREARADGAAIAGCFLAIFALYLPFGFSSSGHWEEWIIHGYAEGGPLSFYATEAVSRPFVMTPHTLARLISSETFIGHHILSFLMYAGGMALLYLILRQLGVSPLYAFLTTLLFMVYPVNNAWLTLRRLPNSFSELTLLLAVALFLDYSKTPRQLTLLGLWLALLYSVNSHETGFGLVLIAPALVWLRHRRICWRNVNLSAIWYIVPALKVAYVVLLLATGRDFYQSGLLSAGADPPAPAATTFDTVADVMGKVYSQTFIQGWGDALAALGTNLWWLPTAIVVAGLGLIACYLLHAARELPPPCPRRFARALASGLLLIIAAVAVLMWSPLYRADPWRMYVYVPIGGAIAVFSLILLAASPLRDNLRRNVVVIAACLCLMTPATARLFKQHANFVESAERKARILHQILETAPALAPNAQVAVVTAMDHNELRARGIQELLRNDMLNSALHVLYQEGAPETAYFCHSINRCGEFSGGETIFSTERAGEVLGRTLVFALMDDYSLELLEDPAAFLGIELDAAYDADALFVADAPLPPRAATMLAAALPG